MLSRTLNYFQTAEFKDFALNLPTPTDGQSANPRNTNLLRQILYGGTYLILSPYAGNQDTVFAASHVADGNAKYAQMTDIYKELGVYRCGQTQTCKVGTIINHLRNRNFVLIPCTPDEVQTLQSNLLEFFNGNTKSTSHPKRHGELIKFHSQHKHTTLAQALTQLTTPATPTAPATFDPFEL